jgi:hypothetical protein
MSSWKKMALMSLFGGAGFALTLVIVAGAITWYNSRPKPPEPWNTSSIVSTEPATYLLSGDGTKVELRYVLENATDTDYQLDNDIYFKILAKNREGIFYRPLSRETASLALPVFVPAKQKAFVKLSITLSELPAGASVDERVEALATLAIFDDVNHYQINLPRWSPKAK